LSVQINDVTEYYATDVPNLVEIVDVPPADVVSSYAIPATELRITDSITTSKLPEFNPNEQYDKDDMIIKDVGWVGDLNSGGDVIITE
jgi:hypothetical protein